MAIPHRTPTTGTIMPPCEMVLPDTIELCDWCAGRGLRKERFIEGTFFTTCIGCSVEGVAYYGLKPSWGFRYRFRVGAPESVVAQICAMNGVVRDELPDGTVYRHIS